MECLHIDVPEDVWGEILRKIIDFRTCWAIYLTCRKFRKLIQRQLDITARNKDLICTMIGPTKGGKSTLIATLGILHGQFKPISGNPSHVDALLHHEREQYLKKNYVKCHFDLKDKMDRKVIIYDFKRWEHGLTLRKNHLDVAIYVVSFEQSLKDSTGRLSSMLNYMRVNQWSQILVVISNAKVTHNEYSNICKKYMEVYEEYKQYWPELQMKIVPVDSVTGWNVMPRDINSKLLMNSSTNDTIDTNDSSCEDCEGLSFWETLQRFHALGYPIDCSYRIFAIESPMHEMFQAHLMAGVLKVGDLLINSEIKFEITDIAVEKSPVKVAYAQAQPIVLRAKGTPPRQKMLPNLYGSDLRKTSCFIARMIFLRSVELPLQDIKFESMKGKMPQISNFKVLKRLNAITYEPIEPLISKNTEGYVFSNEVMLVEISLTTPIIIDQESTYPDFARFYLTGKSIRPYSSLVGIGVVTSADWINK